MLGLCMEGGLLVLIRLRDRPGGKRGEVSGMIGFTTGGLVTLLLITFGILLVGYLVAAVAWYASHREEPEAERVRGAFSGERGPRAEAATGRRPGSVIQGSGHA